MSDWRPVEVYATFMKLTGELEIVRPDRLSDSINRVGSYLQLRKTRAEPLSVNYPVISQEEPMTTIAKSAVVLVCPVEDLAHPGGAETTWLPKVALSMTINTNAFSMVGDVHLEPRHTLQDHLDRSAGDFLPITNLSALWIAGMSSETHSVQRPFALLNPAAILSFSSAH